jgi:hypothetical protein
MAVALLACSRAELSSKGAQVITSQSAPIDSGYDPKTCKHLGIVIGNGGGAFGGGYMSNESLVEYALNDLRNKAANLGANFVQHDAPQFGVAGDHGSTTTTATVTGNAYDCEGKASEAPASPPAPKPTAAPVAPKAAPEGVAGFRFTHTVEQAKKICEDAGYQFTLTDSEAKCSGSPVNLEAPGEVFITYCETKTCKLKVKLLPSAQGYAVFLSNLRKQLTTRYDKPAVSKAALEQCPKYAQDLAQCVLQKTASAHYEWTWPSKHVVTLETEPANDQAAVVLTYSTPEYAMTHTTGPSL